MVLCAVEMLYTAVNKLCTLLAVTSCQKKKTSTDAADSSHPVSAPVSMLLMHHRTKIFPRGSYEPVVRRLIFRRNIIDGSFQCGEC